MSENSASPPASAGREATPLPPIFGVRSCRGHWHVTAGGEDIWTSAGEALAEDVARAEADRLNAERQRDLDAWKSRVADLEQELTASRSESSRLREAVEELRRKAEAYDRINTPEIDDFLSAVRNEALHQRERWGIDQDGGKEPADWFWLVGYLAGKALHDVKGKRLHHIITTAAALLNWHAHATGHYARMRPGIEPPPDAALSPQPKEGA